MIVRGFWRDCTYRGKAWGARPVDALWVEATADEAETAVFPRLRADQVTESRALAEEGRKIAGQLADPARPFCFLVARDLSTIDPLPVHYPFHPLWNGYSPFVSMPERHITRLEELPGLSLPASDPEEDVDDAGENRDG